MEEKNIFHLILNIFSPVTFILAKLAFSPGPGAVLFFPYFTLGVLASELRINHLMPLRTQSLITYISAPTAFIALILSLKNSSYDYYFAYVAISTFAIILLAVDFFKKSGLLFQAIQKIGSFSYELYLTEGLILLYLRETNLVQTGHLSVDSIIYIAITFIVASPCVKAFRIFEPRLKHIFLSVKSTEPL